jgi:hypothetical protein
MDYFAPKEFTIKGVVEHDYALLRLDREVPGIEEFIPLCLDYKDLALGEESKLTICGYPAAKTIKVGMEEMDMKVFPYGIACTGRIIDIKESRAAIYHTISSFLGQSGAPILLTHPPDSGKYLIIGLHKGGVDTKVAGKPVKANTGRLLTAELIDCLR